MAEPACSPHHVLVPLPLFEALCAAYYGDGPTHASRLHAKEAAQAAPPPDGQEGEPESLTANLRSVSTSRMIPRGAAARSPFQSATMPPTTPPAQSGPPTPSAE